MPKGSTRVPMWSRPARSPFSGTVRRGFGPSLEKGRRKWGSRSAAEPVKVERVDGIMFVTLNRPEARNAVNSALESGAWRRTRRS